MKPSQPTVLATNFGVSFTTGYNFKTEDTINGCVLSVHQFRGKKSQYGDLNGTVYPSSADASIAAIEHGYLRPFCRNSIRFVQSRAARRRGYICIDYRYNVRKNRRLDKIPQ